MKLLGIDIELLKHDCVKIKSDKVIYFDPFKLVEGSELEKADIIFITHSHFDHCSPEDIKKISDENTILVTIADCKKQLSDVNVKEIIIVKPNEELEVKGLKVKTVPAYNIDKFKEPGLVYHPKEEGFVGFIIEIDGKKIYHAGDTDMIPEMKELDVDIAFLPVSGTYVMTADEAAEATKIMKRCEIAVPMHYGDVVGSDKDAEEFAEKAGCKVVKLL